MGHFSFLFPQPTNSIFFKISILPFHSVSSLSLCRSSCSFIFFWLTTDSLTRYVFKLFIAIFFWVTCGFFGVFFFCIFFSLSFSLFVRFFRAENFIELPIVYHFEIFHNRTLIHLSMYAYTQPALAPKLYHDSRSIKTKKKKNFWQQRTRLSVLGIYLYRSTDPDIKSPKGKHQNFPFFNIPCPFSFSHISLTN